MNKSDIETRNDLLQIYDYFRSWLLEDGVTIDDDKRCEIAATLTTAHTQITSARIVKDGRR